MTQPIRTCVFPVAGLGTRFLPATKSIPKEMLIVGDRPLIDYAVSEARACGIERFIFITSTGKESIEDYFDRSIQLEERLAARGKLVELESIQRSCLEPGQAIFVRQPIPLGLGHAVWCARHLIEDEAFMVALADDFIYPDSSRVNCLAQMQEAYKSTDGNMAAVMDVPLEQVSRYGVMKIKSQVDNKTCASDVVEKPDAHAAPSRTAIIGRYILRRSILDELEQLYCEHNTETGEEIQLTEALRRSLPSIPLTGFHFEGDRLDCGTKEGWLEANRRIHASL